MCCEENLDSFKLSMPQLELEHSQIKSKLEHPRYSVM